MELIRYRPGEAIRWLQTGAQKNRKDARSIRQNFAVPDDMRHLGESVRAAAGALVAVGKGAYTDLVHHQAAASEFILDEDGFDVIRPGSSRRFRYDDVQSISLTGDRAALKSENASIVIKPYAYVVAGRLKVPIGWSRNGIEVPYELLVEELSARCGIEFE